jgi:hypothetical protein
VVGCFLSLLLFLGDPAGTHLSPFGKRSGICVWITAGADTYPAPAVHPQIRLRFRAADAWIPLPDHPSPVSAS